MQKLLSAHQPVYLPWLGFFDKIEVSDLFVIFDDVPYSKKMWYNRNFINGINNKILLSVPVRFKTSDQTKHKDVIIDNSTQWQKKHWKSICVSYSNYPYFQEYADKLEKIYNTKWEKLIDLNLELIFLFLKFLKIKTKIVRASSYLFKGSKSDLIVDMCKSLKFDHYLFGELGKNYCDYSLFEKNSIKPKFQEYVHPEYQVLNKKNFFKNMSILDLLFYYGEKSKSMIRKNNLTKNEYFK